MATQRTGSSGLTGDGFFTPRRARVLGLAIWSGLYVVSLLVLVAGVTFAASVLVTSAAAALVVASARRYRTGRRLQPALVAAKAHLDYAP